MNGFIQQVCHPPHPVVRHFWSPEGRIPVTHHPHTAPWRHALGIAVVTWMLLGISYPSGLTLPCLVSLGSLSGVGVRGSLFWS